MVTQLRGCLGSVPGIGRQVLSLRAGLNGTPQSRGATASTLGISLTREAHVERSALRTLRAAAASGCGGAGFTSTSGGSGIGGPAGGIPSLQPASFLVSSGMPLLSPASLARGTQEVKGVHVTSGAGQSAGGTRLITATSSGNLGDTKATSLLLLFVVLGAGLMVLAVGGIRRRALATRPNEPVVMFTPMPLAPPQTPERAPEPQPAIEPEVQPAIEPEAQPAIEPQATTEQAPAPPPPPSPVHHRAARTGAMLASGLMTVALRELLKRRKRH